MEIGNKMDSIQVESKIGFEDGEIQSFSKDENGTLNVIFKAWNEKHLKISFKDTIRFLDNNMYDISDLVRIESSQFLIDAINMMYTTTPEVIPYKHYQFLNIDGEPSVEIVALDINIDEVK